MRISKWLAVLAAALGLLLAAPGTAGTAQASPTDGGAIAAKYKSLGGAHGYLGTAVSPLSCRLIRGGCVQSFRGGSIYFSPASGTHVTRGAIAARWAGLDWERSFLGYPVNDARCGLLAGGCVQSFQGGTMYWAPGAGASPVHGAIGTKWTQMGSELSLLGYPASLETCSGTTVRTCVQVYKGGSITWNSLGRISVVPTTASIGVVVNKRRPLAPLNYVPLDLVPVGNQVMRREAATQLNRLMGAAASAGVSMATVSGYRSYASQLSLYNYYVSIYGRAYADTISARAGFSEHQNGLAMDIGNPTGACALQDCFAGTPAGSFAAANAWKYGFIVRYPNGYTSVTGYSFEPWHLRYVGAKAAADMHNRGARTLEQYFGLASAPSY